MDLDDLIEDLLPKKQLKKLKKKVKKRSLLQIIGAVLLWVWGKLMQDAAEKKPPSQEKRRGEARPDSKPVRHAARLEEDPLIAAVRQAQTYRMNIEGMALAAAPNSMERLRLDTLSEKVAAWTHSIETIVERTLAQGEDELLDAERERVPKAIRRLEKQLAETDDPMLRAKLERTLESRRRQLEQLERAGNQRQMAELKVENTLAQLGTIYSQLHSGRYGRERGGYERLSAEINEEVLALDDYLHALDEVQRT